ncbi:hypothetical protein [Streptomyces sp. NPDC058335]|uniref:hypothetical protein n=1 Tax=Streptomyces sp. NPDC058335 TaxID=3346451 RepID=UPI00365E9FB9
MEAEAERARAGGDLPQYSDEAQREREIEESAGRPAAVLAEDLETALHRFLMGNGACLGSVVVGWAGDVVGAGTAGLGAGFGTLVRPRPAVASICAAGSDGYVEGIADVVLLSIAVYEAAVLPLTSDGVSDEEQEARRTVAYRLSAYDGLPRSASADASRDPAADLASHASSPDHPGLPAPPTEGPQSGAHAEVVHRATSPP